MCHPNPAEEGRSSEKRGSAPLTFTLNDRYWLDSGVNSNLVKRPAMAE